jgi:hypothetical protein
VSFASIGSIGGAMAKGDLNACAPAALEVRRRTSSSPPSPASPTARLRGRVGRAGRRLEQFLRLPLELIEVRPFWKCANVEGSTGHDA